MANPTLGLYVPLVAKADKTDELEAFLEGGRDGAAQEPLTSQWFALKYGSAPHLYSVLDTFESEEGQNAHLTGQVAAAVLKEAEEKTVLGATPEIKKIKIIASKVAPGIRSNQLTKALRVLLTAKPGEEETLRNFLISGKKYVDAEPNTLVWYAFEIEGKTGAFGLFDAFADVPSRDEHVGGDYAKLVFERAKEFTPVIEKADIVAAHISG